MAHNVFISYSRADTDVMLRIRADLEAAGLTIWTDTGIQPGLPSWKEAIEDAICTTDSVVVLFSPNSNQSQWVRAELDFAEVQQKPVFPILIGGDQKTAVPFGYAAYQWIDIREEAHYWEHIDSLIAAIRQRIAQPPTPTEASTSPAVAPVSSPTTPSSEPTSTAVVTAAAGLPQGWQEVTAGDVSIAIPPGWATSDFPLFETLAYASLGNSDSVKALMSMLEQRLQLYVADWVNLEGTLVLVEDNPIPMTELDVIQERVRTFFRSTPYQLQPPKAVDLPVGQAYEFKATTNPKQVSGQFPVSLYVITRGRRWYAVEFSFTSLDKQTAAEPTIEQMMQSFRINDAATETPAS